MNNTGVNSVNRIYEIKEGFHVDLSRIISMRQFVDYEGQGHKRKLKSWIEIYMDCDQIIVVNCPDIYALQSNYNVLLNAWKTYVKDTDDINEAY